MKLSAILEPLLRARVDPDVILDAIRAFEAQQEAGDEATKEKARARWRKWKSSQPVANVGKRLQPLANNSCAGDARVEDNLLTKNQSGQEEKKERAARDARSSSTPLSELETVLDADRAKAVVDHRSRLRKPLTAHAAKLLAGKFANAPDPNEAADMMVANGWQGFELAWLENRSTPQRTATGPPADDFNSILDGYINGSRYDVHPQPNQSFDAGNGGPDRHSAQGVVQLHAVPARR